jgi:hypothetical protein
MRYVFLCLFYCLLSLSSAVAQIHQPGQRFIEAGGGLTDGMHLKKIANTGYWLQASLGKYGKKEGIYQMDLLGQRKYYQPAEEVIVVTQYFLGGAFSPKAFATADRQFYVYPTVGVLIGHEGTRSKAVFSSDSSAVNPNKFLMGFSGGLSAEWNINSQIALILFARTLYLPSSVIEHSHFQYGIAIRFNYFKH